MRHIIIMPSWYYDQDAFHKTPSIQDGIDYETECAYRREGARFIMDIGTQMDLGCNTMATGVVFFHRFYMFHSFVIFPRFVTACCCIFLAGKVEETPKKCKDIIKIAKSLLNEEAFASFGVDPKEEVMTLEKILLKTIKFDFKVEHPYYYLIKFAKHLKGDKNKLQKMVQMAWTFINDSLCTTLCLQWEPEIIAIALMYLAGKLSKFKVISWYHKKPHHTKWWDMFVENLPMPTLEDICHQVLDLYSTVKDQPQEVQTPSQSIKKNSDIKSENPVELEKICSQQIQVKTEEKSSICNPREAKEVFSNSNPIKHEPPIDLTLAVNVKKEPEFPQEHDQPKPRMMLHVAEWASVSASAVMSPGTYSVISPSFPTPNFLVSPISIGSFNNRFNESTIHGNVNFNKNLPENCQQSKNASTTLFSNQNSVNSNDVTRHTDQSPNLNNLRNNLPLDNCRGNLPISGREFDIFNDNLPKCTQGFDNFNDNIFKSTRGFDNYNDNLLKGSRGFDNCDKLLEGSRGFGNCNDNLPKSNRGFDNFNDNVPKSNRGFDNCNNDLPFRSRGFNECEESVPFRNRGFDNVIEYSLDDNYNCKIADFSKNYQSRDMLIQDYQDSKNLCDRFKYPAKMRNDRDPRTNSRDHPYPISKNDFCVNPFSEPSNSYENTIDLQKYRYKRSERRFRNSKRFRGPTNN